MLRVVFSRVVKWQCVSVECVSYVFNDQQITVFDCLSESISIVNRAVIVYELKAKFLKQDDRALYYGNFANALMTRLIVFRLEKVIEQCSSRLRRLSIDLELSNSVIGDALDTLVTAIGHCLRLRSLHIRDFYDRERWPSLPPILLQLSKLDGLGLSNCACTMYWPRGRRMCISEHWLTVFALPIFQALLGRMVTLKVRQGSFSLPLAAERMTALVALATLMQSSPLYIWIEYDYGQPSLDWNAPGSASLDVMLGEFLRLAKGMDVRIGIYVARFPPTVEQFLLVIAALPADLRQGLRLHRSTIADVRAGQNSLDFHYTDGGQVFAACKHSLMLNSNDNLIANEDNYHPMDWLFGDLSL